MPCDQKRACDKDRRIGTHKDTNDHRQTEIFCSFSTQEKKREKRNHCGHRGIDGTCNGCVNAKIYGVLKGG